MNYQDCQEMAATRRRKLANNTYLTIAESDSGPVYGVRLHETEVLRFYPDGSTILDSGGWQTVTTKARLNEFGPIRIAQERGVWYVSSDGWQTQQTFADGMRVLADGTLESCGPDPRAARREQKRVLDYAKAFVAALQAGQVDKPGAGDCWHCAMREVNSGAPLGEKTRDGSHMESHLEESYYVGSLAVRAVELFGSRAEMQTLGSYFGECEPWPSSDGWIPKQIQKYIAKYVRRELGMVV